MMLTSAIPVWLNITCDQGHSRDYQLSPQTTLLTEDNHDWECSECGSTEIKKVNISGSSNANMKTLDKVRAE